MCEAPICRCHYKSELSLEVGKIYCKSRGVKVEIIGFRKPYFVGRDSADNRYKDYHANGVRLGYENSGDMDIHLLKEFKEPVVRNIWLICATDTRFKNGPTIYISYNSITAETYRTKENYVVHEIREIVFEVPNG